MALPALRNKTVGGGEARVGGAPEPAGSGVRLASLTRARERLARARWVVSDAAPGVSVIIDPTARRHLARAVDADTQVLVLTRGSYGPLREPRWLVNQCDWSEVPPKAAKYCCITRLGALTVIIPQKSLLRELGGRVLRAREGNLLLD